MRARSVMQLTRHQDELVFCHAMEAEELKAHLERLIVPGDCSLCAWFGRFEKARILNDESPCGPNP